MDTNGRPARDTPTALVGAAGRYLQAVLAAAEAEGYGSAERLSHAIEPVVGHLIPRSTLRDWMSQTTSAPPWFLVALARRWPAISFDAFARGQGPAERLDALESAVYELQERWEELRGDDGIPLAHRLPGAGGREALG